VVYSIKSIINVDDLNASDFVGQLLLLEDGSQLNVSFSKISNGKLSQD
jgi:hypothetical protein